MKVFRFIGELPDGRTWMTFAPGTDCVAAAKRAARRKPPGTNIYSVDEIDNDHWRKCNDDAC